MKLPIETDIPLEVLEARPVVYLQILEKGKRKPNTSVRVANALDNNTRALWELLLRDNADVLQWKNFGREAHQLLTELLSERNLHLNMFPALAARLCTASRERHISAAISTLWSWDGVNDYARASLTAAGFRVGMSARELFVYVPPEQPPLTEEQIAFLRKPADAIITDDGDGAWLATAKCGRVLDAALLLPHMRDEGHCNGAVPRLRAAIEAFVGPLPLKLTLEELRLIRAFCHPHLVDGHVFEMT